MNLFNVANVHLKCARFDCTEYGFVVVIVELFVQLLYLMNKSVILLITLK